MNPCTRTSMGLRLLLASFAIQVAKRGEGVAVA